MAEYKRLFASLDNLSQSSQNSNLLAIDQSAIGLGHQQNRPTGDMDPKVPNATGIDRTRIDVHMKKEARKWSDQEVELVIDLYEARPCLWDTSSNEYHLRPLKSKELMAVSDKMKIPVDDIKAKWCSLCSQELQERTKEEKSKSGMGASEVYNSSWQFMSKMRFVGQMKKTARSESTMNLITLTESEESETSDLHMSTENIDIEESDKNSAKYKKRSTKRECLSDETADKKNALLASCIDVLKAPPSPSIDPFALYVSKQLHELGPESRIMAEKKRNDILFEMRH